MCELYQVNRHFLPRLALEFKRKSRHLLLGEIAVELQYSLKTVEYQISLLIKQGFVKQLSSVELSQLGLRNNIVAYAAINMNNFNNYEP
jgi:DNA-binding IclR family transcriptional regulator